MASLLPSTRMTSLPKGLPGPHTPRFPLYVFALSLLVILPCVWHAHLESVDLGSHTYAVWIKWLSEAGKAPGIYIARQSTNILFDWILEGCCVLFGFDAGGMTAAAICVLVFFWGAFAFVTTLVGRFQWHVAFPIAMISYGWSFQTGLFNFYLSLGLAFVGLTVALQFKGARRLLAALFLPLMWLAHPLGLLAFFGVGAFLVMTENAGLSRIAISLAACIAAIGAVRWYLGTHFSILFWEEPWYTMNGSDQLVLYGWEYRFVAGAVMVLTLFAVTEIIRSFRSVDSDAKSRSYRIFALYLLPFSAVMILPDGVLWSRNVSPATFLIPRATTLVAVMAVAVIANAPTRSWKPVVWGIVCVAFFAMVYGDTGRISRIEDETIALVRKLPPGSRFTAVAHFERPWHVISPHYEERACIGHCFVISNYEIASGQFRVRANPGSPVVETRLDANDLMQKGLYVVQPFDLPLYSLIRCGVHREHECLFELRPGVQNGLPLSIPGSRNQSAPPSTKP